MAGVARAAFLAVPAMAEALNFGQALFVRRSSDRRTSRPSNMDHTAAIRRRTKRAFRQQDIIVHVPQAGALSEIAGQELAPRETADKETKRLDIALPTSHTM
jgi:hypothetical protein